MITSSTVVAKSARTAVAAAALLLGAVSQDAAAVVVFQSVPDLTDSVQISQYGWCSSCSGSFRIFDQFTLANAETITGMSVSLYNSTPYWPVAMDFSVWTVSGNLPGIELFSQTIGAGNFTTTPFDAQGAVVHTDSVSGLSLAAGTYFASFYNPINLAINGYYGGGGNLYQQGNVHHVGTSAGFILFNAGVVPESSTVALFGIGLAGLGFIRRKAA